MSLTHTLGEITSDPDEKPAETRTVKRDANGKWLPGGSPISPGRPAGYREYLRSKFGLDGRVLFDAMGDLAMGKPIVCRAPDGRQTLLVPNAETCARMQVELAHMQFGKPVTQTEIMAAEKASHELASVHELSDAELDRQAAEALLRRGLKQLDERRIGQQLASENAELVPK